MPGYVNVLPPLRQILLYPPPLHKHRSPRKNEHYYYCEEFYYSFYWRAVRSHLGVGLKICARAYADTSQKCCTHFNSCFTSGMFTQLTRANFSKLHSTVVPKYGVLLRNPRTVATSSQDVAETSTPSEQNVSPELMGSVILHIAQS